MPVPVTRKDLHAVTVIDAGVGNLGNLRRALEHLAAAVEITDDAKTVRRSRRLILPGVGAFRPPRERLRGAIEEALHEALDRGAFLLGICVGYQLLFESSEEFAAGEPTDGLGLLRGHVTALPDDAPRPHIGWNRLHDLAEHPLLRGIEPGSCAYFVHSFAPESVPDGERLASCTHGRAFAAVAARGRVLGAQFHPEKSGAVGLRFLASFLELEDDAAGLPEWEVA